MNIFYKYILLKFSTNILLVTMLFFAFGIILNLFEEISFFKNFDIGLGFPLMMSFLKVPSMLNELFPFIFLISSIMLFLSLLNSEEIYIIKLTGFSNVKLILYPALISLFFGIIIILGINSVTSKLTHTYYEIKNSYTKKNDYLAALTENGIWIKDSLGEKNLIINSLKLNDNYLLQNSIFVFDKQFNYLERIEAEKIDITTNYWKLENVKKIDLNNKYESFNDLIIFSNFNLKKITNIFTNLDSISFWEINKVKRNFKDLGYSTSELEGKFHKSVSFPIYLMFMTIIAGLTVLNITYKRGYFFYIFLSITLSVVIYYFNYFSIALGETNNLDVVTAAWAPIVLLGIFCSMGITQINEK